MTWASPSSPSTHTGNITLGLALTTETGEEDFVVLVDEVQATIVGNWWGC
jgi:hypothetical protein